MSIRNRVSLIGRVGADSEIIAFTDNNLKAKFSLATTEFYKDSRGIKKEDTHWHTIIAFGKMANIAAEHVKKGKEIAITGRLTYRKYEDKSGNNKQVTEIILEEIQLF